MTRKIGVVCLLALLICACAISDKAQEKQTRSLKERAQILSKLNIKRVDTLLLPAMRKADIDCWIILSREFNKDFVLQYIEDNLENTPGGHRNAYIFFDDGSDRLQKILIGTHLPRSSKLWDKMISYHTGEGENGPSLKPYFQKTIKELDPKKIGVNQSRTIPMCDGLTVEMKKFLVESIGPKYTERLVSAESMIVDFLDTRLPEELPYFKEAAELSKMIHQEVLSRKVIEPGKTTLGDIRWYIYDRLTQLQIDTWYFHGLRVIREGSEGRLEEDSVIVQPGDIVNNDIGIVYMNLHTDYKGVGYVLKTGETGPPAGLQKALQNSLRVQDAILAVSKPGKIGYKLDVEAENLCKEWGIEGSVYCHSTGLAGHGIGASILNDWPDRYGVRATYPLRLGAYYAIESHAVSSVPEWGDQNIAITTEEDAYLVENGFKYLVPRQEKIILIK
ncbi:MAG: M24 family metallopeptidase [Candidatus Aminicenantaceae bacterium]